MTAGEAGSVPEDAVLPKLHRTARPGALGPGLPPLLITGAVARPYRFTWPSPHDDPPQITAETKIGRTLLWPPTAPIPSRRRFHTRVLQLLSVNSTRAPGLAPLCMTPSPLPGLLGLRWYLNRCPRLCTTTGQRLCTTTGQRRPPDNPLTLPSPTRIHLAWLNLCLRPLKPISRCPSPPPHLSAMDRPR